MTRPFFLGTQTRKARFRFGGWRQPFAKVLIPVIGNSMRSLQIPSCDLQRPNESGSGSLPTYLCWAPNTCKLQALEEAYICNCLSFTCRSTNWTTHKVVYTCNQIQSFKLETGVCVTLSRPSSVLPTANKGKSELESCNCRPQLQQSVLAFECVTKHARHAWMAVS